MHIHPNNNLQLAALGSEREEVQAIQARRAAEVRKKLSAASRAMQLGEDEFSSTATRVEARSSESQSEPHPGRYSGHYQGPYLGHYLGHYVSEGAGQNPGAGDGSGRLFSAKA
jgi:hypothetical protein